MFVIPSRGVYHGLKRRLYRPTSFYRKHQSILLGVRRLLGNKPGSKYWLKLVHFTPKQLLSHLEKQFKEGMNWSNYGTYWCVDHIKPVSKCTTISQVWKLSNLQPLTFVENSKKGDRTV